ncbi:hypothetical protein HFO21_34555 [Rhizobium laguerreae]|uniref:hypothetical protein n=1 Tax=Rhizobium laguerreae TaxID=1076926 RepID=UPI001C9209D7|nr:hypothetical protein [Rhizobium laguerreae]MBY3219418.1 hypothetical protein [Rhizobium laguerreae]
MRYNNVAVQIKLVEEIEIDEKFGSAVQSALEGSQWSIPTEFSYMKIHIFGAAGAGSTTLGSLLSGRLSIKQIDVDQLTWDHTTRPFGGRHPRKIRSARVRAEIECETSAIVTGSLCGWGDKLVERFDIGIFLHVPTAERLRRINLRQTERFGPDAIAPGGEYYGDHEALMTWAGLYDYSAPNTRSYAQHRQWMRKQKYPILTLRGIAHARSVLDLGLSYILGEKAMKHRMTIDLGVDELQPTR